MLQLTPSRKAFGDVTYNIWIGPEIEIVFRGGFFFVSYGLVYSKSFRHRWLLLFASKTGHSSLEFGFKLIPGRGAADPRDQHILGAIDHYPSQSSPKGAPHMEPWRGPE